MKWLLPPSKLQTSGATTYGALVLNNPLLNPYIMLSLVLGFEVLTEDV